MKIFAYGFRPFFFLSGVAAVVLVAVWIGVLFFKVPLGSGFDTMTWHSHEMLFGFVTAMIAGFLLTAVPNWTQSKARHGVPLAILTLIWILARFLLAFTDSEVGGYVDLAFYPGLLALLVPPIIRKKQPKFLIFVPILLTLWIANIMFYLEKWEIAPTRDFGTMLAVSLILMLITVIGGRVIPFFTRVATDTTPTHSPRATPVAVIALICMPFFEVFEVPPLGIAVWAAIAMISHSIRLWGWTSRKIWKIPILWILHVGYGWMILGFLLRGLSAYDLVLDSAALHAFTAGAMGVVGLGIMTRASLGHTGRKLELSSLTVASYVVINLAVILRVFGPIVGVSNSVSYGASGTLWCVAFLMFLVIYTPYYFQPRADGKPG